MKILLTYKFDKYYSQNWKDNTHWSKTNPIKQKIGNEAYYLCLNALKHLDINKKDKNNYKYTFYFEYYYNKTNIDPDNFSFMRKAIIDGIKKTDLIIDDTVKHISVRDCNDVYCKENKIIVYFTRKKLKQPHNANKRKLKQPQQTESVDGRKVWKYPNRIKK